MLAGRLPFDGESMAQLMFRIANEAPADINTVASVPPELARFIERSLAKNPDDRYQTGEHFASALRAAMAAPQPATAST
jgi:eukaryotic-like serine/threonine-protein kinase